MQKTIIKGQNNKELRKKQDLRSKNGITLIALVITIIVLLILAGVSIAMLTGENGILTQANNAKTQSALAEEKEKVELAAVAAKTANKGGEIKEADLIKELDNNLGNGKYQIQAGQNEAGEEGWVITGESGTKYFVSKDGKVEEYTAKDPEPDPGAGDTQTVQSKYGVIEVEFLNGTSFNTTETPNEPILKDGMKKVYWEEDGTEVNEGDANFDNSKWYSYTAQSSNTEAGGTSHWANAKTSDGSYYVWIPRYAYRIVYFDTEEHEKAYRENGSTEGITGYSDARGIVDKEGKRPKDVPTSKRGIAVNEEKYRPHPAFENNVDEGGWDSKLTGIWVMKFEASRLDATASSEGSGTIPKSVPGVQSWNGTLIGDKYKYSKNAYNKEENVINEILNSHMMKNSEWGAIAYLTESKYGRNGTEVTINNSNNGITGSAGNSVSAGPNVGTTTDYKSAQGVLASSTGNVYGIYDISGGKFEYTPAYYKDGDNERLNYGSSFTSTKTSDKYATVYSGTSANSDYIPGDATYETRTWNSDRADFVNIDLPFFVRSGSTTSGANSGVFNFFDHNGHLQWR